MNIRAFQNFLLSAFTTGEFDQLLMMEDWGDEIAHNADRTSAVSHFKSVSRFLVDLRIVDDSEFWNILKDARPARADDIDTQRRNWMDR